MRLLLHMLVINAQSKQNGKVEKNSFFFSSLSFFFFNSNVSHSFQQVQVKTVSIMRFLAGEAVSAENTCFLLKLFLMSLVVGKSKKCFSSYFQCLLWFDSKSQRCNFSLSPVSRVSSAAISYLSWEGKHLINGKRAGGFTQE